MMGGSTTPKHVEQFPDINKVFNVASFRIYIGILLGAHYILNIRRIRVKILSTSDCVNINLLSELHCCSVFLELLTNLLIFLAANSK
jgi:hypothetical protein